MAKLKDTLSPEAYAKYLAENRERARIYREQHPDKMVEYARRYWEKRAALDADRSDGNDKK